MSAPKLELRGVQKVFDNGTVPAVDGVDLVVERGETLALLGPSGCGKSTLLNLIVGLELPTSGDILVDGRSVIDRPAGGRDIGLVFQDYAVFTHMTVRDNLAFGLQVRRRPPAEIDRAVGDVAELLGMSDRLEARARDLGGSELQRVAIGRTLMTRPEILLLDEPLSNLEAAARLAMRRELRRLQSEIGLTIVYVTHDQIEALSLADRIAVMSSGKIRQLERTSAIYDRPDHVFVASFLGSPPMNLVRGRVMVREGAACFEHLGFELRLDASHATPRLADGGHLDVVLGVRPEAIRLGFAGETAHAGRVILVEPRGSEAILTVEIGQITVKIVTESIGRPDEGSVVGVEIDPSVCVLFDGETSHRIGLERCVR